MIKRVCYGIALMVVVGLCGCGGGGGSSSGSSVIPATPVVYTYLEDGKSIKYDVTYVAALFGYNGTCTLTTKEISDGYFDITLTFKLGSMRWNDTSNPDFVYTVPAPYTLHLHKISNSYVYVVEEGADYYRYYSSSNGVYYNHSYTDDILLTGGYNTHYPTHIKYKDNKYGCTISTDTIIAAQ